MRIDELIRELTETIAQMHQIGDTPVFSEDEGDAVARFDAAVQQQRRCVVVGWNGCEHAATQREVKVRGEGEQWNDSILHLGSSPAPNPSPEADALYVQAEIVVAVYESPGVTRSVGGAPHLLGMAAAIAKHVDNLGTEDMDEGLHFVRITPIEKLQHGVITCDVVFRTKNNL